MKLLVYTAHSGFVYGRYAEVTNPLMRRYAERVGADFLTKSCDRKSPYPLFDKYRVGTLLDEYDRVLWLDTDVLVRPDAPDLFALVPEGRFAALNEGAWCDDRELAVRDGLVREAAEAFGEPAAGFDIRRWYFNAGVFLADRSHRGLFRRPADHPLMTKVTSEQTLLNIRLAAGGYRTYSLPLCFNAMPWRWSAAPLEDSYFVHYAGLASAERHDRLAADAEALTDLYG